VRQGTDNEDDHPPADYLNGNWKSAPAELAGFAGTLLVKDTAQLAMLQTHDPMTALQRVVLPREL